MQWLHATFLAPTGKQFGGDACKNPHESIGSCIACAPEHEMPYLFLLFVLMPIVEIAVLIQVGGAIGGWTTIGIVILTAVIGTVMLRQQGMATLGKAQQRMAAGEMPAQQMLEGLLLLIGGILLLTPGFITDFFGFCTLFPWSREFLAKKLASKSMAGAGIFVGGTPFSNQPGPGPTGGTPGPRPERNRTGTSQSGTPERPSKGGDVIDGDYERLD